MFVWNTLTSGKEVVDLCEDYSGDLGFLSNCYYKIVKNHGSVSLLCSARIFSFDSLFYSILSLSTCKFCLLFGLHMTSLIMVLPRA